MDHNLSRRSVAFSCPDRSSSWYVCHEPTSSRFVGCCRSDPCVKGCSDGNLAPASFPKDDYDRLSDQLCQVGLWYSCATTNPTFLGCCTSNPCQPGGCPRENLRAGLLSQNPAQAAVFLPSGVNIMTTTTAATTTSSATGSQNRPPPRDSNVRVVVGAVVGGVTLLMLVVGFVLYSFYRKRKREQLVEEPTIPNWSDSDVIPVPGNGHHKSFSATAGHSDLSPTARMSRISPGLGSRPQSHLLETMSAREPEDAISRFSMSPTLNRYSDAQHSPYISGTGSLDGPSEVWVPQTPSPLAPGGLQLSIDGRQFERPILELEADVPRRGEREMPMERPV